MKKVRLIKTIPTIDKLHPPIYLKGDEFLVVEETSDGGYKLRYASGEICGALIHKSWFEELNP